jgi:type VI secretion system protein ImpJ
MEPPRPLYWHQGLFLQPQHFQLADLHSQFLAKPGLELSGPYAWGIGDLAVSAPALDNRIFEIERARMLFRDGTYVEFPGNAVIRPRSFETAWVNGDQPFTVLVGLKKLTAPERNVSIVDSLADLDGCNTRFVTTGEPDEIADLYADGPSAKVRRLSLLLRVFWQGEAAQLDGYETITVARLERDGDRVVLSPSFVPPCFSMAGSDLLARTIKELRDELAGRVRQLEMYKSPREMQKAEFDASYMVYLLALRSLNRYAPLLYHLSETPRVHPWAVYGLLRQIVGELSSFSERFNLFGESLDGALALPSYNHEDLGRCILSARSLIENLLNEITIGPEFVVSLKPSDGIMSAELPKGFFGARHRYYLVVRSEAEGDGMLESFQMEAKLAAASQLAVIVRRALPGVELIRLPAAPQGLPRRSYSHYFRIEPLSHQWRAVEAEASIALNWSSAPPDLSVDLVALRG